MPGPLRVAYTLEQLWHDVPGGTAVAALELLGELVRRDDVEIVGVAGRHRRPPAPAFASPIDVRTLPLGRPWLYETWNRVRWPRVESVTGPIDACHSTVAIPAATTAPHVVTVHDVAFVHTPERFTAHGVRVMTRGLDRCREADLVICPSQATADDLEQLGFDTERVRVVPWGVTAVGVTSTDVERVRRSFALPDEFVLYVGTIEPRKNLPGLAAAVARLDPPLPLVVAGVDGWGEVEIDPVTERALDLRFIGFVPHGELHALYAAATVFAYPSLHEGFGMPILEAMASGAPVVTSRGGATEEAAGGAAVLVDPGDPDSIAGGLRTAIDERARWVEAGAARAIRATWSGAAEATVAAYREVAT